MQEKTEFAMKKFGWHTHFFFAVFTIPTLPSEKCGKHSLIIFPLICSSYYHSPTENFSSGHADRLPVGITVPDIDMDVQNLPFLEPLPSKGQL